MKTTAPLSLRTPSHLSLPPPSLALCFIGRCYAKPGLFALEGGRTCGGPKPSVISERLMVASRCFIIFSKCKFVHGPRLSLSRITPEGRGGPYKTWDSSSHYDRRGRRGKMWGRWVEGRKVHKSESSRGLESRTVDCRRQFMVLSRPANQLAP